MIQLPHPGYILIAIWAVWLISWIVAAVWSSRAAARPGLAREAPNRIFTIVGALLMTGRYTLSSLPQLWPPSETLYWIAIAGTLIGIAFAWWARVTLGALWSGSVTRKEDHRIVDTGPYAIVRHPIYTGVLIGLWPTAFCLGRIEPIIGVVLMTLGFWLKAKLEESFLVAGLGEAAYADYKRRVPMLLPLARALSGKV